MPVFFYEWFHEMDTSPSALAPKPFEKASIAAPESAYNEGKNPPSFLRDAIPREVLDNVLKFFSRLPRAKNWETHISLDSIVGLYGVIGMGCFLKTRFRTLCVSDAIDCSRENKHFKWKRRRDGMLWTNKLDSARRFVSEGGGESLHTIIVGYGMYNDGQDSRIAADIRHHCPNITSLSVHDPHQIWLPAFGEQLKSLEILEIATETPADVSRFCHNLRELTLHANCDAIGYPEFWRKVGPTLEYLSLSFYNMEVEEIGKIQAYCRNIRHICIYGLGRYNTEISDVYASYGDQLMYCNVQNMCENDLRRITAACKNARFSVNINEDGALYPALAVLGHQLDHARVDFRGYDYGDYGDITNAWNGCSNVREVLFICCEVEDVSAFMAAPKTFLRILHTRCPTRRVKTVVDIFSTGAHGLEELSFTGLTSSRGALDELVEKNKCTLSYVSMGIPNMLPEHMDLFAELPNLVELHCGLVIHRRFFSEVLLKTLVNRGVQCLGSGWKPYYVEDKYP